MSYRKKKMDRYGYVYKTTNLLNGMVYIGQRSKKYSTRYLGSGFILKRAIKKDGINNFKSEILAYADNQNQLNELEIYYIAKYRDTLGIKGLYNICNGGRTNRAKSGEFHPLFGTVRPENTRNKIGVTRKLRGVAKGENNPMFGSHRVGDASPNFGRTWSDNTKEKHRATHLGRVWIHKQDSNLTKNVKEQEVQHYLDSGWILGRGDYNPNTYIWMHSTKLDKETRVNIEQVDTYVDKGWVIGRKERSETTGIKEAGMTSFWDMVNKIKQDLEEKEQEAATTSLNETKKDKNETK